MKDEQQFEQLMLQYNQLKTGSEDIKKMIEQEDFDGAITMIKSRESIFLNCKCMRKYLELTAEQKEQLDNILDELRELEIRNIKLLTKSMDSVQSELRKAHSNEKIQSAYEFNEDKTGNIINIKE